MPLNCGIPRLPAGALEGSAGSVTPVTSAPSTSLLATSGCDRGGGVRDRLGPAHCWCWRPPGYASAATAGDAAQGRETEAEEIVGRITTGGSIGFIIFTGLFFGLATGALYLVIMRWLPPGRLGGLAYGLLLLSVAAPRIDPLRGDKPDFGIVGPGWVAVLVFSALVLVHGMLVALPCP